MSETGAVPGKVTFLLEITAEYKDDAEDFDGYNEGYRLTPAVVAAYLQDHARDSTSNDEYYPWMITHVTTVKS